MRAGDGRFSLNGKAREVAEGVTVGRLLEELKLQPLRVAVQVNTGHHQAGAVRRGTRCSRETRWRS
ncbi:MAG: hypothetical protein MZV70_05000 [Desulfobacterales bacterium]|nr:hypothetical protein [Desulfobacterales bacterium]